LLIFYLFFFTFHFTFYCNIIRGDGSLSLFLFSPSVLSSLPYVGGEEDIIAEGVETSIDGSIFFSVRDVPGACLACLSTIVDGEVSLVFFPCFLFSFFSFANYSVLYCGLEGVSLCFFFCMYASQSVGCDDDVGNPRVNHNNPSSTQ